MKKFIFLCLFISGCGSGAETPPEAYGPPYDPHQYACAYYTPVVGIPNYGEQNIPAIRAAIDMWNEALGEERFRELRVLPPNEINPFRDPVLARSAVLFLLDSDQKPAGIAFQGSSYGPCTCFISMSPAALTDVLILVHEMGHCLGLEHVPAVSSVMHDIVLEDAFITQEMVDLVKGNTNENDPPQGKL